MRKTAKTLSIIIMAFAMSICFFFASLTFIKAQNATVEVGLTVLPGAEVYVPVSGNLDDTGIRFTVKIPETGYQELADKAGEEGKVYLGLEFGSIKNGEFTALSNAFYTVKDEAPESVEGIMQYSYKLMYNLDRIFTLNFPGVGYIESTEAENYEGNEAVYEAQQDIIDKMYLKELCIRPWYKVVPINGEEEFAYGEVGSVRSMLHVAIAEINEYDKGGKTVLDEESYEYFTSTYLKGAINDVTGENEYKIGMLGGTNVPLTDCDTYILESSGEIVARKGASKLDFTAHAGKYKKGDVITLYGINSDRTVVKYTATYAGVDGEVTTSLAKQPVVAADGKMYLNNTGLESAAVDAVYYNGLLVSNDGETIDVSKITEKVGNEVELIIKVGEELYNGTSLYVTKAFENTIESKHELTQTIGTSNTSEYRNVLTGYYALVEDITFYDGEEPTKGWEYVAFGGFNKKTEEDESIVNAGVNTFNATFDGRGYALNNVIMDHKTYASGYSLSYNYGMFGKLIGNGAVLKNFAINGVKFLTASGVGETRAAQVSALFAQKFNTDSTIEYKSELSNVSINVSMNSNSTAARNLSLFSDASVNSLGFKTVSNVIINYNILNDDANTSIYIRNASNNGNITEITSASDTYFIINRGNAWGTTAPANGIVTIGEEEFAGLYTYSSITNMVQDGNNYDNFYSTDYWMEGVEGIPVWKSTYVNASLFRGESEVEEDTITSSIPGETFTLKVYKSGVELASGFEATSDNEAVTVSADCKTITVLPNKSGTANITVTYKNETVAIYTIEVNTVVSTTLYKDEAVQEGTEFTVTSDGTYTVSATIGGNNLVVGQDYTVLSDNNAVVKVEEGTNVLVIMSTIKGRAIITVHYAGEIVATYTFNVDTREATDMSYEVLLSKNNGNFLLSDEAKEILGEFEIEDVAYDFGGETGKVSIFSDGVINATNIPAIDGTEANAKRTLYVNTTENKYVFSNVKVYDRVFEDTADSRAAFIAAVSGTAGTSTEGSFALAEDLHFVEGEQFSAPNNTTFNGLFDGYGHILYNITTTTLNGIFGHFAGTCTLRNFAIKGITALNAYNGALFRNGTTDSVVNMSNVYIYNKVTTANNNAALICYNKKTDNSYGTWNMSNVFVEQEFDTNIAAASRTNDLFSVYEAKDLDGEFNGVYFLTNGISNLVSSKDGNLKIYRNPGAADTRYNTLADARAAMVSGNNTYDTFSDDYWVIDTDGLPAWRACYSGAFILDSNDKEVASVSATTAGEEYSVVAYYNGELVEATLAKAEETDLVSIAGNVVTIGTGVGSVVINVTYNETVIGSVTFNVEVVETTTINDEILVSKANGKIYLADTSIKDVVISSMTYNDTSIYSNNVVDTSVFTNVGPENAYMVEMVANDGGKYVLTKVVVYDGVFEDTAESRAAFITAVNATAANVSNKGAYALAEDLHFEEGETFSSSNKSTFDGLFDGYGHTLYNVTLSAQAGIFGYYAGACTLRNFAIVGISTTGDFNGALFRNATPNSVVNMNNVYIYRYVDVNKNNNAIFVYSYTEGYGTWNMSNVFVEQEFDSALTSRQNDIFSSGGTPTLEGEIAGVYFITNGYSNIVSSANGNLKLIRKTTNNDTRYNTLAEARAAMPRGDNTYDSFSDAYWIIDTDGLPAWKTLQNTAE